MVRYRRVVNDAVVGPWEDMPEVIPPTLKGLCGFIELCPGWDIKKFEGIRTRDRRIINYGDRSQFMIDEEISEEDLIWLAKEKVGYMHTISNDIDFEQKLSHLTKIDGYQMVEDLYFLSGLQNIDLPLQINRKWHPKIQELYNRMLSGEKVIRTGPRLPQVGYETDFYIYELEPIDDWNGYHHVFLDDLIKERKWLNLIHHTFRILKENSHWEQDIISGPYISALPGMELTYSHWVVLLKQENNGDTFVVSRFKLDYLSEFLIAHNVVEKG
jgi:hypothetical protein